MSVRFLGKLSVLSFTELFQDLGEGVVANPFTPLLMLISSLMDLEVRLVFSTSAEAECAVAFLFVILGLLGVSDKLNMCR